MNRSKRPGFGVFIYFTGALMLALYFAFAAVQGEYGVFRRAEVDAKARDLRTDLDAINIEVARMENLTHRLSDEFLDLDLLDERARDVLGMIRADEIVVTR
ncbi:septum formation initiator family protein [Marivivens donghaensis]|uniref:Septum formation initiator family protein n=1 Tax=Marivivens donghaensis TaxID=1699413 RepID=A0ABX0VX60_9RHOB|nr:MULTISPECIES: septum formation initiator family protein [Marivivens]NIY72683.1 septum formation initiator family protein [Marivivens donghaensis]